MSLETLEPLIYKSIFIINNYIYILFGLYGRTVSTIVTNLEYIYSFIQQTFSKHLLCTDTILEM